MIKRLCKGFLCAALSASMVFGSVMVGASEKAQVKLKSTEGTRQDVTASSAPLQTKKTATRRISGNARYGQTVVAPNIWTVSSWNSFAGKTEAQDGVNGTVIEAGCIPVGMIQVNRAGTLIVRYYSYRNDMDTSLTLYNSDGSAIQGVSFDTLGTGNNRQLWVSNLRAGTYILGTKYSCNVNDTIQAGYLTGIVPKDNNRAINGSGIAVAGNGGYNYQYFKISRKGIASLRMYRRAIYGGPYSVEYRIQRKSGSSWKYITSTNYSSSSRNYMAYKGLSAGTYRLVTKIPTGNIAFLYSSGKTANYSYGTKKRTSRTIKRKKYIRQAFTVTDSAKKAHYYKIKVSKKRTTYIDFTSLGSEGTVYCQISGRTRFKSKNIKNGKRFYAKAKAGTYYIKVYRYSKTSTGGYQLKYTR